MNSDAEFRRLPASLKGLFSAINAPMHLPAHDSKSALPSKSLYKVVIDVEF